MREITVEVTKEITVDVATRSDGGGNARCCDQRDARSEETVAGGFAVQALMVRAYQLAIRSC